MSSFCTSMLTGRKAAAITCDDADSVGSRRVLVRGVLAHQSAGPTPKMRVHKGSEGSTGGGVAEMAWGGFGYMVCMDSGGLSGMRVGSGEERRGK